MDLSIYPPPISHDMYHIEENFEWFINYMEPEVKFYPLFFQYRSNVCNLNLEFDPTKNIISSRDTFQTLPSTSHDSLSHDLLDQPNSNFNDVQPIVSSTNQEQDSCVS